MTIIVQNVMPIVIVEMRIVMDDLKNIIYKRAPRRN